MEQTQDNIQRAWSQLINHAVNGKKQRSFNVSLDLSVNGETWPASKAYQLFEMLQKAIIQGHPDYDNAAWGV